MSSSRHFATHAKTRHDHIGHHYIGHNYVGLHYVAHNYIGHNYISASLTPAGSFARTGTHGLAALPEVTTDSHFTFYAITT